MDFAFDARTEQLGAELVDFMVSQVHPAEPVFAEQLAALDNRWTWSTVPVLGELRERARSRGCGTCSCPANTARA
jgi:acyl-CoA dehydrogenase